MFNRKIYMKKYRQKNKEKITRVRKEYCKYHRKFERERSKRYRENHLEQCNKLKLKYYYKNKEQDRERRLKRLYGISVNEYKEMFKEQSYSCAICGDTKNSKNKSFHIDHCHKRNKVRGILCHLCNVGLGHFKEDVSILQKAIEYLKTKEAIWQGVN